MSPLRDNLDQAKADYGQLKYRGNLARDVLGAVGTVQAAPGLRPNPWVRRAIGIAAALALSAATFFAGSYVERRAGMTQEVATTSDGPTPIKGIDERSQDPSPNNGEEHVATTEGTNEEAAETAVAFTVVPSLASASVTRTSATTEIAEAAAVTQQSMDFSMSVPSSPMLFSLASLAAQEQQTTTDGEEERS